MKKERAEHEAQPSRRDILGLLGVGVGIGVESALTRREALLATAPAPSSTTKAVTFPKGAVVRTILRDVPPEALAKSVTLFHEHLAMQSRPATQNFSAYTYDVDSIIEDVNAAQKVGVGCIVDGGHPDMGRNLEDLQTIATRTSVHIVASGGYYLQRTYPANIARESEDQIADDLVMQARLDRLGAFGEIGAQFTNNDFTPDERKVFRAVGKASIRTDLPVFTHNPYGLSSTAPRDAGLRQLDLFESVGLSPKKIAIGHMCCLDDPTADIIKQIAKRGAYVGFDRESSALTARFISEEKRIKMILAFLDAGYKDNLLLSSDFDRATNGIADPLGFGGVVTKFAPMFRAAVSDEAVTHGVLYDNPRRFLAFVPKKI